MKTIIEPFRAKMVERITFTTREQREALLDRAGHNLFNLRAEEVIIDLLTDSGTSAMSSEQWAALMRADESYAGCSSFYRLQDAISDLFGFQFVIPVHQGRAAERLLLPLFCQPGQLVLNNTYFDTTRANIEKCGAIAVDLPVAESADNDSDFPFKGNIDIAAVSDLLGYRGPDAVALGMITLTSNSCGGQPASLANIAEYAALLRSYGIPFIIDAARCIENAWLIKRRDPECSNMSIRSILRRVFAYADGCMMSAKKDGIANMGGFIALRDAEMAATVKESLILTEGFPTYGGLSGRDLETIAVGLVEATCEDYLQYREASSLYLANKIDAIGIPLIHPPGLHAIYLDAGVMLPHIPALEFPGQALVCELYLEAGIRSCEIGSVMFGKYNHCSGETQPAKQELVRLALPRRVYSQSHYEYVAEALANIYARRQQILGLRIIEQPQRLRHFTARFKPVTPVDQEIACASESACSDFDTEAACCPA
jgi:tyrosine phenol-lyase